MSSQPHIPTDVDLVAFISRESHDLKSPFNRVLGFVKLVLKGMDGPISDQAREDLNTAYQNGQYALTLVSGLIEIARLNRQERAITLGDCALDGVVRQVTADWQRQSYREQPVEFAWNAPACIVKADSVSLHSCLTNWISYVVEYVQQNARVEIQVEEHEQTCLVSLRSTGSKKRQVSECDTTIYGYIAHHLLMLNHGQLLHTEEDERGVLIQFRLPKV
jgi:K+-sensing histidine kinase KdpD